METRQFKENVKSAAAFLQQQGFEVPHTQLLEAISRAFGERNWSTMRALLEAGAKAQEEPGEPDSPPLSPAAARICMEIRQEMWEHAFGILSREQAEIMVEHTATLAVPEATETEKREAVEALWVD